MQNLLNILKGVSADSDVSKVVSQKGSDLLTLQKQDVREDFKTNVTKQAAIGAKLETIKSVAVESETAAPKSSRPITAIPNIVASATAGSAASKTMPVSTEMTMQRTVGESKNESNQEDISFDEQNTGIDIYERAEFLRALESRNWDSVIVKLEEHRNDPMALNYLARVCEKGKWQNALILALNIGVYEDDNEKKVDKDRYISESNINSIFDKIFNIFSSSDEALTTALLYKDKDGHNALAHTVHLSNLAACKTILNVSRLLRIASIIPRLFDVGSTTLFMYMLKSVNDVQTTAAAREQMCNNFFCLFAESIENSSGPSYIVRALTTTTEDGNTFQMLAARNKYWSLCRSIVKTVLASKLKERNSMLENMLCQQAFDRDTFLMIMLGAPGENEDLTVALANSLADCSEAIIRKVISIRGKNEMTVFNTAVTKGNASFCDAILSSTNSITKEPHRLQCIGDILSFGGEQNKTALILAILGKHFGIANTLFNLAQSNFGEDGVEILLDACDTKGMSILELSAAENDGLDLTKRILNYIAKAEEKHPYLIKHHVSYLRQFLMRKNNKGQTLLTRTVSDGAVEPCKMALELSKKVGKLQCKIDLCTRNKYGQTALMIAITNGNDEIASLIQEFAKETDNKNYIEAQIEEIKELKRTRPLAKIFDKSHTYDYC